MNKNRLSLVVKSQAGGTWPDADFNLHQKVRHVLDAALDKFHLDARLTYEVLLVRTVGRTVDGDVRA